MSASYIRDIGMKDGRFIRALRLDKAGDQHPGERHFVDHETVVTLGTVQVEWSESRGGVAIGVSLHTAGTPTERVHVAANRWHTITAIGGPAEWECQFDSEEVSAGRPDYA